MPSPAPSDNDESNESVHSWPESTEEAEIDSLYPQAEDLEAERSEEDERLRRDEKFQQAKQAERHAQRERSTTAGSDAQGDAAVREAAKLLTEMAVFRIADLGAALRRGTDKSWNAITHRDSVPDVDEPTRESGEILGGRTVDDQQARYGPDSRDDQFHDSRLVDDAAWGDEQSTDEILTDVPPSYDVAYHDPTPNIYTRDRRVPGLALGSNMRLASEATFDGFHRQANGDGSDTAPTDTRPGRNTVADAAALRSNSTDVPSARASTSSSTSGVAFSRPPSVTETASLRSVGRVESSGAGGMFPSQSAVTAPSTPIRSISMSPGSGR